MEEILQGQGEPEETKTAMGAKEGAAEGTAISGAQEAAAGETAVSGAQEGTAGEAAASGTQEGAASGTEGAEAEEAAEAVVAGVHNYSDEDVYVMPEDPWVLKKLEWFKDQKLGLMMHWGPYSQLGIVESWALSDRDADWSREGIDWEVTGEEFKKEYFALNKTFNPLRFEPEK